MCRYNYNFKYLNKCIQRSTIYTIGIIVINSNNCLPVKQNRSDRISSTARQAEWISIRAVLWSRLLYSSRSKTGRFYPFESRKLMTEILIKKKKNTVKRCPYDVEPLRSVLHQSDGNKTACVSKASYIVFVFNETELH